MRTRIKVSLVVLYLVIVTPFLIQHDNFSREITVPGYYTGTVVDGAESCGKTCHRELLVLWDHSGKTESVAVNVFEYRKAMYSERYAAEATYTWYMGATGTAYIPSDEEQPLLLAMSLLRVVTIILVLYLIGKFVHSFYTSYVRRLQET